MCFENARALSDRLFVELAGYAPDAVSSELCDIARTSFVVEVMNKNANSLVNMVMSGVHAAGLFDDFASSV